MIGYAHELLAFRTDLPEDQLSLGPDGRINEDALPKLLDTGTDLAPGTHRTATAPLTPGRYVLVCNLPGHYRMGHARGRYGQMIAAPTRCEPATTPRATSAASSHINRSRPTTWSAEA